MIIDLKTYTNDLLDIDLKQYQQILNNFENETKLNDWYKLDISIINNIKRIANRIKNNCDIFLVIGIGGSINNTKAIINALGSYYKKSSLETIFVATSDTSKLQEIKEYIKNKKVIINVVSFSGNTIETNYTLKYFLNNISITNLFITTNNKDSELLNIVKDLDYESLNYPSNASGRFSAFSIACLLPLSINDIDIDSFFKGAMNRKDNLLESYQYAYLRNKLYNNNKCIEVVAVTKEKLQSFGKYLNMLASENESKNNKGILVLPLLYPEDLHTMGQYIQDGTPNVFETIIAINSNPLEEKIITSFATSIKEKVPTIIIKSQTLDAYTLGNLFFFFYMASIFSCYLSGTNYHDNKGIENYKNLLHNSLGVAYEK